LWKGKPTCPKIRVTPFEDAVAATWPTEPPGIASWINGLLRPYYAWSDKLGDYYADAYRSAFVLAFLFGGLAVFFAILAPATPSFERYEAWFVGAELVLILSILGLIAWGRHEHWHRRWVSYRLVAELIRQLRFLAPLGGARPFPRMAAPAQHGAYGDPTRTWMYWYARAVARQVGLPTARIDREYLEQYISFLQESINEQIAFHSVNKDRSKAIEDHLRITGVCLFAATALACLTHLMFLVCKLPHPDLLASALILIAGVFPAFGAALAAIRDQGEFQRLEMRSAAMVTRLEQSLGELEAIRQVNRNAPLRAACFENLAKVAQEVATVMVGEVLEWRIVFLDRPLETRA
jgi:hypothetical protein